MSSPFMMDLSLEELPPEHTITPCPVNMSLANSSSCNNNSTSNTLNYKDDEKIKYITLIFYMATFFFGLIGNSLVIYIIGHFHNVRKKSVANYYIWNLAFADELFILALPMFCWATFTHQWPMEGMLGNISCKVSYVVRDINKFASVFTLVALSVDRCIASFHHLLYLRTIQVGKAVCVAIWVTCALISLPYLMHAQTIQTAYGTSCRLAWPRSTPDGFSYLRFWTFFQLIVGLIVPSVVILTSYIVLYVRLSRMVVRNKHSKIKKPSKRMTQTVLAVVITFILCQTPYHAMQLIAQWRVQLSQEYARRGERYLPSQQEVTTYVYLNCVSIFLVFISSCCNPIIYGLLNENYRRLYNVVLCRCYNGDHISADGLELDPSPHPPIQLEFQVKFHVPCQGMQWKCSCFGVETANPNRDIELNRLEDEENFLDILECTRQKARAIKIANSNQNGLDIIPSCSTKSDALLASEVGICEKNFGNGGVYAGESLPYGVECQPLNGIPSQSREVQHTCIVEPIPSSSDI